jgi:PAS domain S-box-containing protein
VGWPEFLGNLSYTKKREMPYVLIIDDDVQLLESIGDFLEDKGFRVFKASDGTTGLQSYYTNNPDLVITDLKMPGMSGLELMQKIRAHQLDTEIIVLTGHGELNNAVQALRYHAFDFLLKPVDLTLLGLSVMNALRHTNEKKDAKQEKDDLLDNFSELKVSQNKLSRISSNSPHALIAYDKTGAINFWNDMAGEITGYTSDEAMGKTVKTLLIVTENLINPLYEPTARRYENVISQIMTKAQELRYISRHANELVDEEGKVIGGVESFIDITDNLENERLQNKHLLQVKTINEIGKKIASTISLEEVTQYICLHLYRTFFESSQISVVLFDSNSEQFIFQATAGNYTDLIIKSIHLGKPLNDTQSVVNEVFLKGKPQSVHQAMDSKTTVGSIFKDAKSIHAFPIRSKDNMFGVFIIENMERLDLDLSDVSMIETLTEYIGISNERTRLLSKITNQNKILTRQASDLMTAMNEQEKQKNIIEEQNQQFLDELSKAGEFQKSLLPESFPEIPSVKFSSTYIPSNQLGGDFFDVFKIGKNKIGFVIADAAGHGVTAAMLSAMFKMTFHKHVSSSLTPSEVMTNLNLDFSRVLQMGEFFTAFYGVYNYSTGVLSFCNAGHPYPLLLRYSDLELKELDTEGFILGVMNEGIGYSTGQVKIDETSRLVIFTDGLTDSENTSGKLYGDERIKNDLKNMRSAAAEKFLKTIEKDLANFTETNVFDDDITILVIDFLRERK